jgi:hypothetical protein
MALYTPYHLWDLLKMGNSFYEAIANDWERALIHCGYIDYLTKFIEMHALKSSMK